jgi:NADH dehydrogenase [ubiquinone] 1 alpha subcomplex assembly factor 2
MQWLRHTRHEPPTIAEQQQDTMRQERMKVLAAQADERWASKPSALDAPDKQQPMQMLQSRDPDSGVTQMNTDQDIRDEVAPPQPVEQRDATPFPAETGAPQQMPRDPPVPATTDNAPTVTTRKPRKKEPKDSPWSHAAQSKEWQPQGWTPAPAKRRA